MSTPKDDLCYLQTDAHPIPGRSSIPDARIADGSVIRHRSWGPVMTVTYQPPRVTFAHEEGPNADVGNFQAACCSSSCANS